jgi:transcriptional regulator with XRE-family HTH domain|nr:MAG TPA: helix-turn-helix domain protein [Bacteriophage sp.]
MHAFNEHLRNIRKSNGVTQKQVAEAVNVTERNYQYYEAGTQKPSFDTLIALAEYFNVSLDYLVGLSDNPERR